MIHSGGAGGRRAFELHIGAGQRSSRGQARGGRGCERHGVAFGGEKASAAQYNIAFEGGKNDLCMHRITLLLEAKKATTASCNIAFGSEEPVRR